MNSPARPRGGSPDKASRLSFNASRRTTTYDGTAAPTASSPLSSIFTLGGSKPTAFQLPAADISSSSTRPIFQPTFGTTTEDQLGWDQMEFGDILATLDAPQQAEEVGQSQLT
jgi:hypothetical protein